MTQYRLKLLTTLANVMTTHLMEFNQKATEVFVLKLVAYIDEIQAANIMPSTHDAGHFEIRQHIPEAPDNQDKIESLVLPYGFSLLTEIVFNLIVYCQADVQSPQLRKAILQEIREILNALIISKQMMDNALLPNSPPVTALELTAYMRLKRKKLNLKMLILTDCIALEEPLPEGLLEFVQQMSEIYELRGVAYKDLQLNPEVVLPNYAQNNLYKYWLLHTRGGRKAAEEDTQSPFLRTEFFRFIEDHCRELMEVKYKIK